MGSRVIFAEPQSRSAAVATFDRSRRIQRQMEKRKDWLRSIRTMPYRAGWRRCIVCGKRRNCVLGLPVADGSIPSAWVATVAKRVLPAYEMRDIVNDAIEEFPVVVIVGATGCGKSTQQSSNAPNNFASTTAIKCT